MQDDGLGLREQDPSREVIWVFRLLRDRCPASARAVIRVSSRRAVGGWIRARRLVVVAVVEVVVVEGRRRRD